MNTVVKDSNGNELKKVTLTLSEKNTAVEDVTLSGLPVNATFDDSRITTDGSGKLYLWIPKDAEVETVTVGGNKYYPKSDGSMTIGDVPEFTSPTEDVSRVVKISEYMTLTVEVTGTPAPALQWAGQPGRRQDLGEYRGRDGSHLSGAPAPVPARRKVPLRGDE